MIDEAIEQAFVAEVFNADRNAALLRNRGLPQTAAELIESALAELWECLRADAQTVADRYVIWEGDKPRARTFAGNVEPIPVR